MQHLQVDSFPAIPRSKRYFFLWDTGVKHALPGYRPKKLLALAERWKPWRGYVVMNLWCKEK